MLYLLFILGIILSHLYEVKLVKDALKTVKEAHSSILLESHWCSPVFGLFQILWLLSSILEVLYFNRPYFRGWGAFMLLGWSLTLLGRLWLLDTLRTHWNALLSDKTYTPILHTGPYQYIRHPHYLIFILDVFCIPMIHTAYLTALIGSCINGFLIRRQLRQEESYLRSIPQYCEMMGNKPQFVPQKLSSLIQRLINQIKHYPNNELKKGE